MHTLDEWIAGFASDAVRVQKIFAAAAQRTAESATATDVLFARQTEVSFTFTAAAARSLAFELHAIPLNLNYAIRFRTRAEKHHRVRLSVMQCPVDTGKPLP